MKKIALKINNILLGVGSDNEQSTKFYTMDLNDDDKEISYTGAIPQFV